MFVCRTSSARQAQFSVECDTITTSNHVKQNEKKNRLIRDQKMMLSLGIFKTRGIPIVFSLTRTTTTYLAGRIERTIKKSNF